MLSTKKDQVPDSPQLSHEQGNTESTKEQPNLVPSSSSLPRMLGQATHERGSKPIIMSEELITQLEVVLADLQEKIKTKEPDQSIKTGQKRKWKDIKDLNEKLHIRRLEMEVAELTFKIFWLRPNHVKKMKRFLTEETNWLKERMDALPRAPYNQPEREGNQQNVSSSESVNADSEQGDLDEDCRIVGRMAGEVAD